MKITFLICTFVLFIEVFATNFVSALGLFRWWACSCCSCSENWCWSWRRVDCNACVYGAFDFISIADKCAISQILEIFLRCIPLPLINGSGKISLSRYCSFIEHTYTWVNTGPRRGSHPGRQRPEERCHVQSDKIIEMYHVTKYLKVWTSNQLISLKIVILVINCRNKYDKGVDSKLKLDLFNK